MTRGRRRLVVLLPNHQVTKSFVTSSAPLKVFNGPIPVSERRLVPSNEAEQTISADSLTAAQILLEGEAGRSPWSCRSFVDHSLGT